MTDTIKRLKEVREALAYYDSGNFDGGTQALRSLNSLDAVIAGMQKPALTPEQRGELIEEMREAFTVENIKPYKYRGDPIEAALAVAEKRLLGEG